MNCTGACAFSSRFATRFERGTADVAVFGKEYKNGPVNMPSPVVSLKKAATAALCLLD